MMRQLPLRRLLTASPAGPERIFFHSIWFRGHNNPRYAELLPGIRRLDQYLINCSDHRIVRGMQFRALLAAQAVRYRLILALANRRYEWMFTADNEQIPYFAGPIVSDVDDPKFTEREVALLNRPNVAAYVVTHERAAKRFEEMGVRKSYHVIPQGISLRSVSVTDAAEIARRLKTPDQVVVGYVVSWLLTAGDRGDSNPNYNVDHLLEVWNEIHSRLSDARLWLIGQPSEQVIRKCRGRDDILLLGRIPQDRVLSYIANFDVALYPRPIDLDTAPMAVKVVEYMGLGIPTVSYSHPITEMLKETGAGILADSPREFVAAVEKLALDDRERRRLATAAKRAGAAYDWDKLALRYETEVLDHYLA